MPGLTIHRRLPRTHGTSLRRTSGPTTVRRSPLGTTTLLRLPQPPLLRRPRMLRQHIQALFPAMLNTTHLSTAALRCTALLHTRPMRTTSLSTAAHLLTAVTMSTAARQSTAHPPTVVRLLTAAHLFIAAPQRTAAQLSTVLRPTAARPRSTPSLRSTMARSKLPQSIPSLRSATARFKHLLPPPALIMLHLR